MMNCLDFRRICLSDPSTRSDEYLAHRSECGECARFAGGIGVLDQKLLNAMQVPVPDDLQTRIKLRQVIGDEQIKRRTRPWQFALAASIFATVALSGFFGYQIYSADQYIENLQVAVLDHVEKEHPIAAVKGEVSPEQFQRVMAVFGGKVIDNIAPVNHAEVCALRNKNKPIAHTVLKGETGAITVLYIRGERVQEEVTFEDERFKGMLIPAGKGNLVVIGEPGESLQPVVKKLKGSIVWEL